MLAAHYRRFFESCGDALHVRAHSHHPWPDVTRAAQLEYWEDSVRFADRKWRERIFAEVVPEAQGHVAAAIELDEPGRIAFAPNTHELVARLYSCLPGAPPWRVLTTASEFHSFDRQTRRLEEAGCLEVTRVPVQPWQSFATRLRAELERAYDLAFFSQVFFDTGFALEDLGAILGELRSGPGIVAIDGYHAFMALPVRLGALGRRIFYLGGGYKYAQAGEGAAFLSVPVDCALRPRYTGWFAQPGALAEASPRAAVRYGSDALRFWGATFDASGLYRLNAVMRWLQALGVGTAEIRAHVGRLQQRFLEGLGAIGSPALPVATLVPPAPLARGSFLSFDLPDAEALERRLDEYGIGVDHRGRYLRFGFGLYHDAESVDALLERLARALRHFPA